MSTTFREEVPLLHNQEGFRVMRTVIGLVLAVGIVRQITDGQIVILNGALRRALSPDFPAGALAVFILWRVGAEESGAAKEAFGGALSARPVRRGKAALSSG
jgi:hypothetical protein